MRTRNECQSVIVIKRLRDILPEGVPCPSRRNAPSAAIVRVGPQEVTHRSFMRDLLHTVNGTDMIEGVDGGRKTSVKAEYLGYRWVRVSSCRQQRRGQITHHRVARRDTRDGGKTQGRKTYLVLDEGG